MQPGERRIVWAYHNTSDFIDDNWQKHTEKGFLKFAFLKAPKPNAVRECCSTSTPGPTIFAASLVHVHVGNVLLIIAEVVFCSLSFLFVV